MKTKYIKLIMIVIVLFTLLTGVATATKPLPSDYGTANYSEEMIQKAEEKISIAEEKLAEIREKELNIPKEKDIVGKLELAKEELKLAKQYFDKQSYFDASSYATNSRTNADLAIFYFNPLLEGRLTDEGFEGTVEETPNRMEIKECGTLFYFFSKECKYCSDQEVQLDKLIFDKNCLEIIKKDTDKDPKLIKEYNIRAFPTLVFIDKNSCLKKSEGLRTDLEITNWVNNDKTECSPLPEEEVLPEIREIIFPEEGKKAVLQTFGKKNILRIINPSREVVVETEELLEIKENKLYLNEKEVKIMPDVASEKAIETLQLKKEVVIELKDTGKPTYEITGKKEVKIFGLFKVEMPIIIEIDAETGNIEKTKKPWWRFLVKE